MCVCAGMRAQLSPEYEKLGYERNKRELASYPDIAVVCGGGYGLKERVYLILVYKDSIEFKDSDRELIKTFRYAQRVDQRKGNGYMAFGSKDGNKSVMISMWKQGGNDFATWNVISGEEMLSAINRDATMELMNDIEGWRNEKQMEIDAYEKKHRIGKYRPKTAQKGKK